MEYSPVEEALHYSSPLISIEKFKEQCLSKIDSNNFLPVDTTRKNVSLLKETAVEIGVDEETITDLMEVCNLDNLTVSTKITKIAKRCSLQLEKFVSLFDIK